MGLDKLLSYLEKDNYTDSITKFPLKSPTLDPIQSNGYVLNSRFAHTDNYCVNMNLKYENS